MSITRWVIYFGLFTMLGALPPAILQVTQYSGIITPRFWLIFFFITALTFLVVMSILIVQKINAEMYAQAFLAGTTFKILACLFFAVIFIHKNDVNRLIFTGNFFYVYLLNTAFEVYCLLINLRNQKLK